MHVHFEKNAQQVMQDQVLERETTLLNIILNRRLQHKLAGGMFDQNLLLHGRARSFPVMLTDSTTLHVRYQLESPVLEHLWRLRFSRCAPLTRRRLSQGVNTHFHTRTLFLSKFLMFNPALSPGQACSTCVQCTPTANTIPMHGFDKVCVGKNKHVDATSVHVIAHACASQRLPGQDFVPNADEPPTTKTI